MPRSKRAYSSASVSDSGSGSDSDGSDLDAQVLLEMEESIKKRQKAIAEAKEQGEEKRIASHPLIPGLQHEYVFNSAGLESKLAEIALPSEWPWVETLSITADIPLDIADIHDDLKREAEFYASTLSGVKLGIAELQRSGIPFIRPADYYAEMLKPDKQMARVKDALLAEQRRIDSVADRKKSQEMRKFAREVAAAKQQEKAKEKKANFEETKRARKSHSGNNRDSLSDRVEEKSRLPGFEELRDARRKFQQEKREKKVNKKRERRDAKFGYGGQKKFKKSNTAESTSDFKDFSMKRNRKEFAGFRGDKPGRRGSEGGSQSQKNRNGSAFRVKNRPGKQARQKARSHK